MRNKKLQGVALLEFSLITPLLFLFVFIIFDFGIFLFNYLNIQHISYQVARSASRLIPLQSEVTSDATKIGELCRNLGEGAPTCCPDATYCPPLNLRANHEFLIARAELMMNQSQVNFKPLTRYTIKTRIDIPQDTVEVTIGAQYSSLWTTLGIPLPLQARAKVPWLK